MEVPMLTRTGPVQSLDDSEDLNLQLQCLRSDINENESSRKKANGSFHQAINGIKKQMDLVDKNHQTLASEVTQCQAHLEDKIGRLESALEAHQGEVETHTATDLTNRDDLKLAQTALQNRLEQLEADWVIGKAEYDHNFQQADDRVRQLEAHATGIRNIDHDLGELRSALEYSNETLPPLSSEIDNLTSDMTTIRESLLFGKEQVTRQSRRLKEIQNRLEQISVTTASKIESLEQAIKGTQRKFSDRATWTHTETIGGPVILPCQGISKCEELSRKRENQLKHVILSTQETRSGLGVLRQDVDNLFHKLRLFQVLNEEKLHFTASPDGPKTVGMLESSLRQIWVILEAFKSAISGPHTIHVFVSSKTIPINPNRIMDQANRNQVRRIEVDLYFTPSFCQAFALCVLAGILWLFRHFFIKISSATSIALVNETEGIYIGSPQYY